MAGPVGAEATAGCELVPAYRWAAQHDALVLCGGGVGITALLSMLRGLAARRAAGQTAGLPRRVYCVWAARSAGEFKALDAPLLDAATQPGGWLQLRLHHTVSKSRASLAVAPLAPAMTFCRRGDGDDDAEAGGGSGSRSGRDLQLSEAASGRLAEVPLDNDASFGGSAAAAARAALPGAAAAAAAAAPCRDAGASPYGWSLLRPVQPKSFGVGHLAAVYVLTFYGAFCAVLLAASYAKQVAVEGWQVRRGGWFC